MLPHKYQIYWERIFRKKDWWNQPDTQPAATDWPSSHKHYWIFFIRHPCRDSNPWPRPQSRCQNDALDPLCKRDSSCYKLTRHRRRHTICNVKQALTSLGSFQTNACKWDRMGCSPSQHSDAVEPITLMPGAASHAQLLVQLGEGHLDQERVQLGDVSETMNDVGGGTGSAKKPGKLSILFSFFFLFFFFLMLLPHG